MKKHRVLAIIVFITGLLLSSVAAYFSIVGLATIFSGVFWPIVIMGTILEVAKLVSVSWLYHNWHDSPFFIKSYLTFSVLVLLLITSMGIFGYLSKSHLEQQLRLNTGVAEQIAILDNQIKNKENSIVDLDKQIGVIDNSINKMIEKGQAKTSLSTSSQQKTNREGLNKKKDGEIAAITVLKEKRIGLDSEHKKMEAEVGPVKYIAELIYGSTDQKILDKSVRFIIIVLIFVFDPLAILLLLAFNISINKTDYDMEFFEVKNKDVMKKKKSGNGV